MSHGTASLLGSRQNLSPLTGSLEVGNVTPDTSVVLNVSKNLTGTERFSVSAQSVVKSDITTSAYGFYSGITTEDASFTLTTERQFAAFLLAKGAASTLTTNVGFYVAPAAANSGTNRYAFQGEIAGGTATHYNLYMNGTARNYLAGVLGVGTAPVDTAQLTLAASTTAIASLTIPHGVAPSSPGDGNVWSTTAGLFIRINGVTKTVTLT